MSRPLASGVPAWPGGTGGPRQRRPPSLPGGRGGPARPPAARLSRDLPRVAQADTRPGRAFQDCCPRPSRLRRQREAEGHRRLSHIRPRRGRRGAYPGVRRGARARRRARLGRRCGLGPGHPAPGGARPARRSELPAPHGHAAGPPLELGSDPTELVHLRVPDSRAAGVGTQPRRRESPEERAAAFIQTGHVRRGRPRRIRPRVQRAGRRDRRDQLLPSCGPVARSARQDRGA